jgi:hypothetical protein
MYVQPSVYLSAFPPVHLWQFLYFRYTELTKRTTEKQLTCIKKKVILYKITAMTFDNSKTIISLRIKLFGATVLLLAFLALTYAARLIKFPILGLNDSFWTVILIGVWVILALMPMVLNYQFISYSDDGEYIVFRYFTAGIVGGKKNSVEIKKTTFSGYKIEIKFFGLIQSIILFRNSGRSCKLSSCLYKCTES